MKKAIIVLSILYLILTVHTGAVLLGKKDYRSAINTLQETKEVSSFQSAKDGVILLKGTLTTSQPITEEKLQNKEFALLEINTYKRRKANWKNIDTEQHISKQLLLNNETLPVLKEIRFSMEPITLSGKDISAEDYSLKKDDTQLTIKGKGYRYTGIENKSGVLIFGIKKGDTLEGDSGSEILIGKTKEDIASNMKLYTFAERYGPFVWIVATIILISIGIYLFRKNRKTNKISHPIKQDQ
ncbi:hypothetical protein QRE62_09420 [Bacillus mycoides]|uniref:hypothetical protein n=1 Tax=Bacillus TaxID=1386 RepID=UPI000DC4544A|nr:MULTISPECIES: hypothetical protein [Bacillus]MDI6531446.1 hypothetical protein [Bacillus mycoides]RAN71625.1 hypothetical protein B5P40_07765 [Bacillus sp. SRB_8]WJE59484.1 hypothetical protein QRE64_05560 [Bacillus mycoides]WJE65417.1 hypothetical protein QRE63_05790 [Bacillus mycoides]WJE77817.1 hypothetical protein QRE62_09420 [Bacillus mycoides]